MGDSCLGQAMAGAAFGGFFGTLVGGVSTTYSHTLSKSSKLALQHIGKSSFQYALIASTFAGVTCASEGFTARKGPHNSVFGGIAVGTVAALLKQSIKHGLAFGGVSAIAMGALDLAGGSLDTRSEKDLNRFNFLQTSK